MLAPSVAVQNSRTTTPMAGKLRTFTLPRSNGGTLPADGRRIKRLQAQQVVSNSSLAELDERIRSPTLSHAKTLSLVFGWLFASS